MLFSLLKTVIWIVLSLNRKRVMTFLICMHFSFLFGVPNTSHIHIGTFIRLFRIDWNVSKEGSAVALGASYLLCAFVYDDLTFNDYYPCSPRYTRVYIL